MQFNKLYAILVGLLLLGLGACVSPNTKDSGAVEASYSTGTQNAPIDGWVESN